MVTTSGIHTNTQINQTLFFQIPQVSPFYFMFKLFPEVILGASAFPNFRGPVIALNFFFLHHIYQTQDLIVHTDNC